jgi:hypothetical protein
MPFNLLPEDIVLVFFFTTPLSEKNAALRRLTLICLRARNLGITGRGRLNEESLCQRD